MIYKVQGTASDTNACLETLYIEANNIELAFREARKRHHDYYLASVCNEEEAEALADRIIKAKNN